MPSFKDLEPRLQDLIKTTEKAVVDYGKDSKEVRPFYLQLKKEETICGAICGRSGKVCVLPPHVKEDGYSNGRCKSRHGGNSLKGEERTSAQKLAELKLQTKSPIHSLYQENGRFLASLTDEEIQIMKYLDDSIRSKFVVEEGFDEVILEDAKLSVIKYFRKVNNSFETELRGVTDQMITLIKKLDELGWKRKTEEQNKRNRSSQVLDDLLSALDRIDDEDDSECKQIVN
ncbi:hypothetical protein COC61_23435 [Priestia megaterium]|uniref:hypothetical protein n=1 Tax=Priestia megaterium TaxID=1404 RepID=UPI000BFD76B5|nr:hypothetical protein [Priestia megaterium]PGR91078.1 hypothetical protein COC61_23435 [Priestia megaterium]